MKISVLNENQWHQILKCRLDGVHTEIIKFPGKFPPKAVVTVPYSMKNEYEEFLCENGYLGVPNFIYTDEDLLIKQDGNFLFTRVCFNKKIYIKDILIVIHPDDVPVYINF